jgi:hypothetical protein
MVRINPKQVEWLVYFKPLTQHTIQTPNYSRVWGLLSSNDIYVSKDKDHKYYLTTETYNSLPTEFKQLADDTT